MHDSVRAADGVVPVATDLDPGAAGGVVACEIDAVDRREGLGQQAVLERDREIVLTLEEERALDGLRDLLRERRHQRPFAVPERAVRGDDGKTADHVPARVGDRVPAEPAQPPR